MFENKFTEEHKIHYTRYIMSWIREGGNCRDIVGFKDWLYQIGIKSEDEMKDMIEIMLNGKMEFEDSAREFLENH